MTEEEEIGKYTDAEMEKWTVAEWEKFFGDKETQPGTIDLNKEVSDDERETETGIVDLFKD